MGLTGKAERGRAWIMWHPPKGLKVAKAEVRFKEFGSFPTLGLDFGSPCSKDPSVLGSILGPAIHGNLHLGPMKPETFNLQGVLRPGLLLRNLQRELTPQQQPSQCQCTGPKVELTAGPKVFLGRPLKELN